MSPNFRIALRFLTARKRALLMSLAGVAFGVGFFVVTQAQTRGFEQFFIRTIQGTNGAIRIEDRFQDTLRSMAAGGEGTSFQIAQRDTRQYREGIEEPALLIEGLREFSNVSAISPVLRGSLLVRASIREEPAQAFGIQLDDHLAVSDLGRQIIQGSLPEFRENPTGILMGSSLANRLQLQVGDSVILEARDQSRRYRLAAIYETGVTDIDRVRVFMHLPEARSLLQRPFGVSFLQVDLFDRDRAFRDARHIEAVLGHRAASWQEREKVWLEVFRALSISSAVTVSTIILISGLGMFNTLVMIVMEKTKEIAILRSMGYTRRDISRIFLWQGFLVLVGGIILGWMLGAAVTYGVSVVPIRIRGIFSTDSFVVYWSLWHYLFAALTAAVIVMVATFFPARRAARLEPGDVIRGSAS